MTTLLELLRKRGLAVDDRVEVNARGASQLNRKLGRHTRETLSPGSRGQYRGSAFGGFERVHFRLPSSAEVTFLIHRGVDFFVQNVIKK